MSAPFESTEPPPRTESGFEAFQRFILSNAALQDSLTGIIDRGAFTRRAVELGQQHGFSIQPAEVEAAIRAARRTWTESRML